MPLVTVEGLRIFHRDEGRGSTVVFVHGSPGSSMSARRLRVPGARLLALDLPGFGRSDKPPAGLDFRAIASLLAGWFDAMDMERMTVVGQGWGAPIALWAASRRPERVARVVVMNTTCRPTFRPPWLWRTLVRPGVGEAVVVQANAARHALALRGPSTGPEERRAHADALVARGARRTVLRLERQEGWTEVSAGASAYLSACGVPTLILWGTPDRYFGDRERDWLVSRAPDARVVTLPGAGGAPQVADPGAVSSTLAAFLASSS